MCFISLKLVDFRKNDTIAMSSIFVTRFFGFCEKTIDLILTLFELDIILFSNKLNRTFPFP